MLRHGHGRPFLRETDYILFMGNLIKPSSSGSAHTLKPDTDNPDDVCKITASDGTGGTLELLSVTNVDGDYPVATMAHVDITGTLTGRLFNQVQANQLLNSTGNAVVDFAGGFSPAAVISVLTTGSQNNYAPSGWSTCFGCRLTPSGTLNITGFAAAGGNLVFVTNLGPNTITLKHASVSSTATNRIECPGAVDFALTNLKSCWMYYDSSSQVWRVIG